MVFFEIIFIALPLIANKFIGFVFNQQSFLTRVVPEKLVFIRTRVDVVGKPFRKARRGKQVLVKK
jgi:hypothetical protein